MWTRPSRRSRTGCETQTKWLRRFRVRTTRVWRLIRCVTFSYILSLPCSLKVFVPQDELARELEELEQQQMDDLLVGAEHAPVHLPGAPKTIPASTSHPCFTSRMHMTDLRSVFVLQNKWRRRKTRRQSSRSCKQNLQRCDRAPLTRSSHPLPARRSLGTPPASPLLSLPV